MAKYGILGYENKTIENPFIDEDKEVSCDFVCGWKGRIKDCIESETARNEGFVYKCPRCNTMVESQPFVFWD